MRMPDNRKGFSGWKLTLSKRPPNESMMESVGDLSEFNLLGPYNNNERSAPY